MYLSQECFAITLSLIDLEVLKFDHFNSCRKEYIQQNFIINHFSVLCIHSVLHQMVCPMHAWHAVYLFHSYEEILSFRAPCLVPAVSIGFLLSHFMNEARSLVSPSNWIFTGIRDSSFCCCLFLKGDYRQWWFFISGFTALLIRINPE